METFSNNLTNIISKAITLAKESKCNYIGTGHLLLGIWETDCTAKKILTTFNVDYNKEIEDLRKSILNNDKLSDTSFQPTESAKEAIKIAVNTARNTIP